MNNVINPDVALRFTDDAVTVSLSTTTARTAAALAPGFYYITSSADCHFKQGGSAVTATSSANRLWAKERVLVRVRGGGYGDDYVAAILAESTGTLEISRARF